MSTREAIIAARSQVRSAAQQLLGTIDGQPAEDRAALQDWTRRLRAIEAEMERFLAQRAN